MKVRLLALVVLVALIACPAFTQTEPAAPAQPTLQEQLNAAPAPEMNLQFNGALPASFRGGDPDSECVHVLEDAKYQRQEHTLMYADDAQAAGLPAGTEFQGPPEINWTTEDGNGNALGDQNNNSATSESEFPEPGEYKVGNSGARQVGGSGGGASDSDNPGEGTTGEGGQGAQAPGATTPGGEGSTGQTGAGGTGNETPTGEGQDEASRRMTSTQTRDVICHDVTSPCIWAAIQEGAGDVKNFVAAEEELRKALEEKMQRNMLNLVAAHVQGEGGDANGAMTSMFSNLEETPLEHASLMAVFEYPINITPVQKSSACAVKGPVFNELGQSRDNTELWGKPENQGLVPAAIKDQDLQTRLTAVTPQTVGQKGVYVRRNVPFMIAAIARDNGDKYQGTADAACYITKKGEDTPVEKVDNAYLFRKHNLDGEGKPVEGEPEYEFVAKGNDKDGNATVVRLPLYIVNTQVSYEGGRTE